MNNITNQWEGWVLLVLACSNGVALFFLKRFIARFDSLVVLVQELVVSVAQQNEWRQILESRLKDMREDRLRTEDELWKAIEAIRERYAK